MIIKSITLNNFRIYKGENEIEFTPDEERNIVIISGNNGFGKTTFLMSLVWCLYGRQMDKVDDLYKKEIDEKGGYGRYIGNSLNREAQREGETRFSVSVTFTDVEIPDTTCTEITIVRSYDSATNTDDELHILIDGKDSDLFTSKEETEFFIRDYILPIEIAKFFFFDAEKIVSFAEINTPEQRRELSKAYSQVLGIQKYDALKKELERLQDEYRKDSAQPEDRHNFIDLTAKINKAEESIETLEHNIKENEEKQVEIRYELSQLQEKLVREGDLMSIERLHELNEKREKHSRNLDEAQEGLKDLYNYIPFGLAGNVVSDVAEQLKQEKKYKQNKIQSEVVKEKTINIINELEKDRLDFGYYIDYNTRKFYENEIEKLISKHFYSEFDTAKFDGFQTLHDLTDIQNDEFFNLIIKIKESKTSFEHLSHRYTTAKAELYKIDKEIRDAEKNAESAYIQELRGKKDEYERQINEISEEIGRWKERIEKHKEEIKADKQKKEILSKKIEVATKNKAVDDEASRLIHTIKIFLQRFKVEKKKSLEKKLEEKLKSYMHKSDFVQKAIVDIHGNGEDVDINLYDIHDKKIDKANLSMGEKQLFASALLGALVEETQFEFPVFIDSPMQKLDPSHSKNILTKFYPTVSKQVVFFPLLMKELTEEEYDLIKNITSKTYLIHNEKDGSHFVPVEPSELFENYKKTEMKRL
ncbi:MAG: DNA sulfur modification protein DndD [Paludibacteraceae bacterium]|nr:DNA sulfur modification protein DndD [Paludibacteraceae bacterium]